MIDTNKIIKHSVFHWSVYTEVIIDASKETVWKALTNFKDMAHWSKGLQNIEGELKNDSTVIVYYIFKGDLKKIKHKIIGFEKGVQFGWSDPLIPFAKDNHFYRLESLPDGKTKFIQRDEIKGFSALFIGKMMANIMTQTYPEFNHALKRYVENNNLDK